MNHEKIKELILLYHDGELGEKDKKEVEEHIAHCPECQKEFEEMKKLEEVMGKMELKKPGKEVWEVYWASIYNRLERKAGWILMSIGGMILLFYGGYKFVEGIIQEPSISLFLKVGILAFLAGAVVMLVSQIKEQIFVYKRERYKEIEK
jgi:predicted anti-sigma-YlaC factor YlaD